MSIDTRVCQGQHEGLMSWTQATPYPSRIHKFFWHCKRGGMREAIGIASMRLRRALTSWQRTPGGPVGAIDPHIEVLNLQPGEWVRVKPEPMILATLDACGRYKGLAWIPCMHAYCGKEYRVYKKVEKIILESTGEIRRAKNTVLLEGVVCEGLYGCDRSCFPFWREIWLERIQT